MTCGAVDPITGTVCGKDPENLHVVHKCVDDGIEFTWKDESGVIIPHRDLVSAHA